MKKSLLALAVLGAFAGSAVAQVTIFGKIDAAVGKPIASADKQVMDNAGGPNGSRIGFRGYEALSADMGALFAMEHRFNIDTGANADARGNNQMWQGFSFVGLRSASMGTLTLGRHYTSAFTHVQSVIDPFAGETVAALRNIAIGAVAQTGVVTPVRFDNSVQYTTPSFSGFVASATLAERSGGPDRNLSLSATYTNGPLFIGVAHDNPTGANDDITNFGARYKVGSVLLAGMLTNGSTNTNADVKASLIGATVTVGAGDIKVGVTNLKVGTTKVSSKLGLGYHHNLSKRTKLYADFARDSKVTTPAGNVQKTGYDFGIQHNF